MFKIHKSRFKQFTLGALVAALGAGTYVIAAVTFSDFQSGTTISASEMNAKLNALKDAVNANAAACPARSVPSDPRFTDNGDTICDADTGLMWEKKTQTVGAPVSCTSAADCPDPHNVNNTYVLTGGGGAGTAPDGPLFTLFLAQLNGYVGVNNADPTCYAGHCNWRIPTIEELQTIIDTGRADCAAGLVPATPCINTIFDPAQASNYWSSSSTTASFAWGVNFSNGSLSSTNKSIALFARAVRGGR